MGAGHCIMVVLCFCVIGLSSLRRAAPIFEFGPMEFHNILYQGLRRFYASYSEAEPNGSEASSLRTTRSTGVREMLQRIFQL